MLRFVVSAGLCILVSAGLVVAQQTHGASSKVVQHKRISKRHHTPKTEASAPTRVDVYNGANTQTQVFNEQPANRAKKSANPAPAMTRVDVINGSVKQMQVFSPEPASGAPSEKSSRQTRTHTQRNVAEANFSDVEIFNGTTKQRRVFKGDARVTDETSTAHRTASPVVVGIAATGAGAREKRAPRVVTGIESGQSAARQQSAEPVAVGLSPPPPKRPPYVPVPEQ
jgi:hypothetical protein